jgi:hypothetical protein
VLTINGKELTFSKSFLMERGEEAVFTGPEFSGETLRLSTFQYIPGMSSESDVKAKLENGEVHLRMPFLEKGSFATGLQLELNNKSSVSIRIGGQSLGGKFLVHLDIYLSRPANYAPR